MLGATGLGLGLIRQVARMIGGDLRLAATDEGRATVTLTYAAAGGKA